MSASHPFLFPVETSPLLSRRHFLSNTAGGLGGVALAWLLHRAPNILLIPGTSSVAHLRENLAAGQLTLSPETLTELEGIASTAADPQISVSERSSTFPTGWRRPTSEQHGNTSIRKRPEQGRAVDVSPLAM